MTVKYTKSNKCGDSEDDSVLVSLQSIFILFVRLMVL